MLESFTRTELSGKQLLVERVMIDSGTVLQRTPIETSSGTVYSWAEDDRYLVRAKNRGVLRGYLRTRLPKDSYVVSSETPLEERGSEAIFVVERTGLSDAEFRQALSEYSGIIEIEASPIFEYTSIYSLIDTPPNDTWFSYFWYLHNTGQDFIDHLIPFVSFHSGTPDADVDFLEAQHVIDQAMYPAIYPYAGDTFLSWTSTSPSGVVFWNHKTLSWETYYL